MADLVEELIQNETLQNNAYNYLKKNILKGFLKPGEKIIETEIASKLGISKSPVREAMRKLEVDGLIINKPRIGWFVIDITEKDIKEIFEIREAIEGYAVKLIIQKGNKTSIQNLMELFNEFERAVAVRDLAKCSEIGDKLHLKIVSASENERLIKLFTMIHDQAYLLRNIASIIPGRVERSLQEHKEIINAIQKGDYLLAQEAVSNHIESLKKEVLDFKKGGGRLEKVGS